MNELRHNILLSELQFSASRSSGAGGQHVNKVSSRIELRFNVIQSQGLSNDQRQRVLQKLAGRINAEGELVLHVQEHRSQVRNKQLAIDKFFELLQQALHRPKKRKATAPTRASRLKRLESKKIQAEKKQRRRKEY